MAAAKKPVGGRSALRTTALAILVAVALALWSAVCVAFFTFMYVTRWAPQYDPSWHLGVPVPSQIVPDRADAVFVAALMITLLPLTVLLMWLADKVHVAVLGTRGQRSRARDMVEPPGPSEGK
jgi:hypothetical protein